MAWKKSIIARITRSKATTKEVNSFTDYFNSVNRGDKADYEKVVDEALLHYSVHITDVLIGFGLKPTTKFPGGGNALHRAAMNPDSAVIKSLLTLFSKDATGRDAIDGRDNQLQTPLIIAAQKGNDAVVKVLLESKAELHHCDYFLQTSMWFAARNNHPTIIKQLAEAKADIGFGSPDETPLSVAAFLGRLEAVKTLLEQKADANQSDRDGELPLSRATREGHLDVVKSLVEAKADPTKMNNKGLNSIDFAKKQKKVSEFFSSCNLSDTNDSSKLSPWPEPRSSNATVSDQSSTAQNVSLLSTPSLRSGPAS